MIDTHYDLLTIAYICYLKKDYTYLEEISKYFNNNNVTGVIANLYFMSEEEMVNELHPKYYDKNVSVLDMFKISKDILDKFIFDTDVIYSIEGADFIKDSYELEQLYNNGLKSLIIAWNTESKYASGNRSKKGLTKEGRKLIYKAIDLGIGIDLSHANENSFYDIINLIKKEKEDGKEVLCYASHSNSRVLCDRDRNLTDEQLLAIKDVDGLVGVFSNRNFTVPINKIYTCDKDYQIEQYINQIQYIINFIGEENVMLATDNMDFLKDIEKEYKEVNIFNDYANLCTNIRTSLIKKGYNIDTIENILYNNANNKIFKKINIKEREKKL